ncbi:MAG: hypothetical protein CM1200mP40_21450 [Gammaproteobacteria bacterium]|nr:MAG: hypothetical protein CM1200mP40_21450 [Gammaproteobacteria bacterium]
MTRARQLPSITNGQVRWHESLIQGGLGFCALISIVTTATIIFILTRESVGFFQVIPEKIFCLVPVGCRCSNPSSFGVLPLLWGTLVITIGAALICIPIGLASAIYLSEYASAKKRSIIKPVLELLAGIPTVVYGYFALTFVTPALQYLFPRDTGIQCPEWFHSCRNYGVADGGNIK